MGTTIFLFLFAGFKLLCFCEFSLSLNQLLTLPLDRQPRKDVDLLEINVTRNLRCCFREHIVLSCISGESEQANQRSQAVTKSLINMRVVSWF